ncbi:MAG: phage tail protein [Proteobacteria bacterium]|nr:phage tail protein [Pseudomonadota bacterium]
MASNNSGRKDPLPVFCFRVVLDLAGGSDVAVSAYFKSVSGLKYETESIPVKEGGTNDTTFMLVGATKWSPLTLKQGFTESSALLKWREEWIVGQGTRIGGTIQQLDTALNVKSSWKFTRGWPTKWEISEFDASKSEVAIETLEITHEGLKKG